MASKIYDNPEAALEGVVFDGITAARCWATPTSSAASPTPRR